MDANNVDLSAHLVSDHAVVADRHPAAATAGVMTTRGAASAFFINGTNRAMFRFTMLNHLCNDLQLVMDITRPPDRIRQDVTRSPGGVSTLFLTNCIGCHSGMDPMAQALRLLQFQLHRRHRPDRTTDRPARLHRRSGAAEVLTSTTPTSRRASSRMDDSWSNRWRAGPNYILGWSATLPGSGNGAKSLGQELESSAAFASCQVTRVFKDVCLRAPNSQRRLHPSQLDDLFVPIASTTSCGSLR